MATKVFGDNTGDDVTGAVDCTYIDGSFPADPLYGNPYCQVAERSPATTGLRSLLRVSGLRTALGAGKVISGVQVTWPLTNAGGGTDVTEEIYGCLRNFNLTEATSLLYSAGNSWAAPMGLGTGDATAALASNTQADYATYVFSSTVALVAFAQAAYDNNTTLDFLVRAIDGFSSFRSHAKPAAADGSRPSILITYANAPVTRRRGFASYLAALGFVAAAAFTPILPPVIDPGGWTSYTPVATNGTDASSYQNFTTMTGTRIYLHSWPSGNDATGKYLLWHPSGYIIDQTGSATDAFGVAYGTNPLDPKGQVFPYKHLAYTAARLDGSVPGTDALGGAKAIASARFYKDVGRVNMPDWWLVKRGEERSLREDYLSYLQQTTPGATAPLDGESTLSYPGGTAADRRQILGSWGDTSLPRSIINKFGEQGVVARWSDDPTFYKQFQHFHFVSLELNGHDRTHTTQDGADFSLFYNAAATVDIQLEDCLIDGIQGINWQAGSDGFLRINRCIGVNTFTKAGAHCAFLHTDNTGAPILQIDDSILLFNGFKNGQDPAILSETLVHTIFDRHLYLTGDLDCINSRIRNTVIMYGGSADQFRAGLNLTSSYLLSGGLTMTANGGNALANSGAVLDNVLEKFLGDGSAANPGFGLSIGFGAHHVDVSRNIVTTAGLSPAECIACAGYSAFTIGGWIPAWFYPWHNQTNYNTVQDNIGLIDSASYAVSIEDGTDYSNTIGVTAFTEVGDGTCHWVRPNTGLRPDGSDTGVPQVIDYFYAPTLGTANTVQRNILAGASHGATAQYVRGFGCFTPNSPNTTDTTIYGTGGNANVGYTTINAAAAALGWTAPRRCLKTYLASVGIPVYSKTGVPELRAHVISALRQPVYDTHFMAKAMINHVRAGINMVVLT